MKALSDVERASLVEAVVNNGFFSKASALNFTDEELKEAADMVMPASEGLGESGLMDSDDLTEAIKLVKKVLADVKHETPDDPAPKI